METLSIVSENPNEIIKQVNKFRLEHKNNWYQVHIIYNGFEFKGKFFNTWAQIFRKYENGKCLYDSPSPMDQKIGAFKEWLTKSITK